MKMTPSKKQYLQAEKLVGKVKYYHVSVIAKKFDSDCEDEMEKIAIDHDGFESGSGWGGERDVSYIFYAKNSIKPFLQKIKKYIFSGRVTITEYVLDWADCGQIHV